MNLEGRMQAMGLLGSVPGFTMIYNELLGFTMNFKVLQRITINLTGRMQAMGLLGFVQGFNMIYNEQLRLTINL